MARIRATFHYSLPGVGLWTDETTLGQTYRGESDDCDIEIILPTEERDFELNRSRSSSRRALGWQTATIDGRNYLDIAIVRVRATRAAPFGSSDVNVDDDSLIRDSVSEFLAGLQSAAVRLLDKWLDLIRAVLGHEYLGTSADVPIRTWLSFAEDLDSGEQLRIGPGQTFVMGQRRREAAVTHDLLTAMTDQLNRGDEPPLAEELLADARFMATLRSPPDLRLAVLLAAIACEAKIRRVLRDAADPVMLPVLEIVLSRPMPALSLVDEVANATTGRSLKTEDHDLFLGVKALFETRNAIAHGTRRPSEVDMRQGVNMAVRACTWLDTF